MHGQSLSMQRGRVPGAWVDLLVTCLPPAVAGRGSIAGCEIELAGCTPPNLGWLVLRTGTVSVAGRAESSGVAVLGGDGGGEGGREDGPLRHGQQTLESP